MFKPLILSIVVGYFLLLLGVSRFVGRKADQNSFYTGNRNSPWYVVAFGMIGASLSGVTFISVPGEVGNTFWGYFQMVLGYQLGYIVIALVLLPLYYRLGLVSIYSYLKERFGVYSYRTGSAFFLISQLIGASFRLFLVATVLQLAIFDSFGIPFWFSVTITVALIWLYTFQSGIKTVVWTDTLQTIFMLVSVIVTLIIVAQKLDFSIIEVYHHVIKHPYSSIWVWDWRSGQFFGKQFLSGAFIAIVMTGLDQNMMQKNLTCKNLKEAQKNIAWFSPSLIPVNLLFLGLGVLLYTYAEQMQIVIPERTDTLFPLLALNEFGPVVAICFVLGITAAAYSSADSSLTSLTTAFCVDFLGYKKEMSESFKYKRFAVHLSFSLLMIATVLLFNSLNDGSVINAIFRVAGYTYGPILGLFIIGIYTKMELRDRWVPVIAILAPALSYILANNASTWLNGYVFGYELLLINALFTIFGLIITRRNTLFN